MMNNRLLQAARELKKKEVNANICTQPECLSFPLDTKYDHPRADVDEYSTSLLIEHLSPHSLGCLGRLEEFRTFFCLVVDSAKTANGEHSDQDRGNE
jgi:hypothetical protein